MRPGTALHAAGAPSARAAAAGSGLTCAQTLASVRACPSEPTRRTAAPSSALVWLACARCARSSASSAQTRACAPSSNVRFSSCGSKRGAARQRRRGGTRRAAWG